MRDRSRPHLGRSKAGDFGIVPERQTEDQQRRGEMSERRTHGEEHREGRQSLRLVGAGAAEAEPGEDGEREAHG